MLKAVLFLIFFAPMSLISADAVAQNQLIFAIDIIRHGDRTPLIKIPGFSYQWREGYGELSPTGMQQENQLGAEARTQYVQRYHLLPEHYVADTLYVRSTARNRTLMSAESFLLGLYPLKTGPMLANTRQFALPDGYQPIPIFSVPFDQDSLLKPDNNEKQFKVLSHQYVYSSSAWRAKNEALKKKYPIWSHVLGIPLSNLSDLTLIGDTLFVYQQHKLPLPNGLSQKDAQEILQNGRWAWRAVYKNPMISTLGGIELLQTIANELQAASHKKRPLKYILFSAHDSTLAAQMSLMGSAVDDNPPYASILNIALFDKGNDQYQVKITYNKKSVKIKRCKEDGCSLNQFLQFVKEKKLLAKKIKKSI